ncbi:Fic family protein [Mucilaginibacter sp. UYNi724]
MNLDLEIEFSKAPILLEVDSLKKQIDAMRPLPADVEGRVMQKLRLDWNYNSNAIEGNKLSYGETVAFLMEGITAKGKPLKDHLDIRGHNEAIHFLTDLVKDGRGISEADIRALHKMILVEPYQVDAQTADGAPTKKTIKLGKYKAMSNHVQTATGETHYYATPEEVPAKMQGLIEWYKEANSFENIHPVVVAALFHHKFVSIHPFDDGNGRLSRILMNLILMQKGFPPAVIRMDDRKNYYSLLSRADSNENWPFVEYILERVQGSLNVYLKAISGGDIDEDEDIDKEIALLQMQFNKELISNLKKDSYSIEQILIGSIVPLLREINIKLSGFDAYFFDKSNFLVFPISTILGNFNVNIDLDDKFPIIYQNQIIQKKYIPDEIKVFIVFEEYKNIENRFSLGINTKILFNEFNYSIIVDNETIVSKPYNKSLDLGDRDKIIKRILKYFKQQMEIKLQSPKSN